jgi:chemotaxis protein MotB
MRHKKHAGGHDNNERWLLTYADMITLLVAFFIMLYAMSIVSKEKFEVLAISVRSGFDGNQKLQSVPMSPGLGIAASNALMAPDHIQPHDFHFHGSPYDSNKEAKDAAAAHADEQNMQAIRQKIEEVAKKHGIEGMLLVSENEKGLTIRILTDKLLFDKGDARLRTDSYWLLDVISSAVKSIPNDITVEGHTDDLAIDTAEYPSNWELSTSRATNVLRYMVEQDHVEASRICAAGYAYTRPLVPNISEANRSRNRRVDIVVLRAAQNISDISDSSTVADNPDE